MHLLRIEPTDPRPIWRQIEEGVLHLVASGALQPATAVPSVRDLARELRVNPATVSKAYQRLTDAGVLAVRRGDGTYVAESPPALPVELRRERLREAATRYVSVAATLGARADEVATELAAAWKALSRARGSSPPDLVDAAPGANTADTANAPEVPVGEDQVRDRPAGGS